MVPPGSIRWQLLAAHAVHALLYLVLIVMGISGIGLLVLSGAGGVSEAGYSVHPGQKPLNACLVQRTAKALDPQMKWS